jgi:hypothetical protein
MFESHCAHDWRMVRTRPGDRGPEVIVRCEDCAAIGIVSDPTQIEIGKAMRRDAEYAPIYSGSDSRVAIVPPRKIKSKTPPAN